FFLLIECRIYRLMAREPIQPAAQRQGGLRVLFWNPSAAPGSDIASHLAAVPADLAVFVNPPYDRPSREAMQAWGAANKDGGGPGWATSDGQVLILSRSPILRHGSTSLGLRGRVGLPSPDKSPTPFT